MKRSLVLLISALALVLFVAACGDDEEDSGGAADTTATTEATTEDTGGGGGGESVAVDIKDIKFNPHDVTVPVGGKIVWTNSDSVGHNVTKEDGPGADFGSDTLNQGDTFEQTFDEAGEIKYVCTIHPGQDGTIKVE
jgi:plastocyanin